MTDPAQAMTSRESAPAFTLLAVAAFLILVWGSAFTMIGVAVRTLTPEWLVSYRMIVGAVIVLIYAHIIGHRLPPLRDRRWVWYFVIGALGASLPFVLVLAERIIAAACCGLASAAPYFGWVSLLCHYHHCREPKSQNPLTPRGRYDAHVRRSHVDALRGCYGWAAAHARYGRTALRLGTRARLNGGWNPVCSVILGTWLLKEALDWRIFVALVIILLGVIVSRFGKEPKRKAP